MSDVLCQMAEQLLRVCIHPGKPGKIRPSSIWKMTSWPESRGLGRLTTRMTQFSTCTSSPNIFKLAQNYTCSLSNFDSLGSLRAQLSWFPVNSSLFMSPRRCLEICPAKFQAFYILPTVRILKQQNVETKEKPNWSN